LLGTTTLKELTLHSAALGKLAIALEKIRSVKFSKDRESVTVTLHNGDRIQAAVADTKLALATLVGAVTVPLDKVMEIQMRPAAGTPEKGLVLEYRFEGDAGEKARDTSGMGNDGIVHGATPAADRHGRAQAARQFNGNGAWIEAPNNFGDKLTREVTVAVWMKQLGPGSNWGRIVSGGSPVNSVYKLCQLPGGSGLVWRPIVQDESFDAAEVQIRCELSEWTWVVGTYDGSLTALYVNGRKVGENRRPGRLATSTRTVAIGGEDGEHEGAGQPSWFHGLLDEVRIYERALTAEEVRTQYEEQTR